LDGLGRRMPWTMAAFLVGALSIVGLPPMGGVWSKWVLIQGTLETGAWILTTVLLISSLLNVAYLLVIPLRAFFASPPRPSLHETADAVHEAEGIHEAPLACLLAIGVTVTGCVALFFASNPLFALAREILP
ncbi:MAG: monovalent cation/H+ antiporter subunit D family protein, partial [Magnetococcales bacterium]|nr:monovalent cation/H+ antiporter subunit D family protein [Magnetococcales bacterium]